MGPELLNCPVCDNEGSLHVSPDGNQIHAYCEKCSWRMNERGSSISLWYCAADMEADNWNDAVKRYKRKD